MDAPFNEAIAMTAGTETRLDLGCCLVTAHSTSIWSDGVPAIQPSDTDASLDVLLHAPVRRLQRLGSVPAIRPRGVPRRSLEA